MDEKLFHMDEFTHNNSLLRFSDDYTDIPLDLNSRIVRIYFSLKKNSNLISSFDLFQTSPIFYKIKKTH